MTTFAVLPQTLDLIFIRGDELSVEIDFDTDLTGYALQTQIIEVLQVSGGNVTNSTPASVNFAITVIDLSEGRFNLSLQESETEQLTPGVAYRWWLRWIAPGIVTRTVLSGSVASRTP
jgi:hypothetical protein